MGGPPSHYYSRRSPPYVEVIDIPQHSRQREHDLSLVHRRRSRSEYDRSPLGDYRRRRRHHSISPSYSRSHSRYPQTTRPLEGTAEGPIPRHDEERDAEVQPTRTARPRSDRKSTRLNSSHVD